MVRMMQCIGVDADHRLTAFEMPEPTPAARELLVATHRVGICATDREIVRTGEIFKLPVGSKYLTLGHEASGVVVAVGAGASGLAEGDIVVPIVSASRNRGIDSHGFFRPFFAEEPHNLVRLARELKDVAILAEPLTVTVEAFRRANALRSAVTGVDLRADPSALSQHAVVVGCGPIGALAALLCRTWDYQVTAIDVVVDGPKQQVLEGAGCRYFDASGRTPGDLVAELPPADLLLMAVPDPRLVMEYFPVLGRGGVASLVGWSGGESNLTLDFAKLFRDMVHLDQSIVASVGATPDDFTVAARQLDRMRTELGVDLSALITKVYPPGDFQQAFDRHDPQDLVLALEFGRESGS